MRSNLHIFRLQPKRTIYPMVRLGEHDPKFIHDQYVANLRSENIALKQSLYELATNVEYAIELGCLSSNPGLIQKIDRILDIVELQLQD